MTSARRSSPEDCRLLHELVDGRPLFRLDLVEAGCDLRHVAVGIAFGQELGPAAAQLLDQVPQAGDLLAVRRAHPRTHQAAEGVVEVALFEEFVGQAGQQVVDVEVGELLGAVPPRVVVPCRHGGSYLRPR